jgi:hypothetical protein
MNTYLHFFIHAILGVIFLYGVYQAGLSQGKQIAYKDCREKLEKLYNEYRELKNFTRNN